jgi:hypothetical protein
MQPQGIGAAVMGTRGIAGAVLGTRGIADIVANTRGIADSVLGVSSVAQTLAEITRSYKPLGDLTGLQSAMANVASLVRPDFALPNLGGMADFKPWWVDTPGLGFDTFGFEAPMLLSQRIAESMAPLQSVLKYNLGGIFEQLRELADYGSGLARSFARAGVMAALRARDAVLKGRTDEVDTFIIEWLDLQPEPWRRDAVVMVLLGDNWLDVEAPEPVDKIKQLVNAEVRNHKSVWETQLRGQRVALLDAPASSRFPAGATVGQLVADPATLDEITIDLGFEDRRVNRLLERLNPDQRRIVMALANNEAETWADAAIVAGFHEDEGERTRRRCRYVLKFIADQVQVLSDHAADNGGSKKPRRR